jgi:hypothetical protein
VQENNLIQEFNEVPSDLDIVHEIKGKYGVIRILKPERQINQADEDIYTLIARILIKKEKRLTSEDYTT